MNAHLALKGVAYLAEVKQLHDGGSHLLLHLDGNNSQLINSKDPDKLKGKYRYRLKRVSPLGNLAYTSEGVKQGQQSQKSRKLVRTAGEKSSPSESEEEARSKKPTGKASSPAKLDVKKRADFSSFNDKRKLFESQSKSPEQADSLRRPSQGKKSPTASAVSPTKKDNAAEADRAFKKVGQKLDPREAEKAVAGSDKRLDDEGMFYASDKVNLKFLSLK